MKKMLLIAIGSLSIGFANAQFTQGQKLIGPSLSFNTNNSTEKNNYSQPIYERKENATSIGLGFSALKFISSKKANGWRLNYTFSNFKNTTEALNSTPINFGKNIRNIHEVGIGYVTRNFIQIKPKLNFYYDVILYGNYNLGESVNESTLAPSNNYTSTNNGYGISVYITPGFTYQLKKNLILDAALNSIGSIGYFNSKETSNDFALNNYERKYSGFNASSSLTAGSLLSNFWFSIKWIR